MLLIRSRQWRMSGADILRLWTMTSDFSEDIRIGKDTIKQTGDLYRRIRNTLRFLLGALDGFNEDEKVNLKEVAALPELEQLVLHQLYETDQKVKQYIKEFEFLKLAKLLHDFCNENLSAFYFDIRKDRLYCDDPASFERRACRSVMAEIFSCLSAWLAPILSFTAEEAWSHRPLKDQDGCVFEDAQSVHLREFPGVPASWQNDDLAQKWEAIKAARKSVLEAIEPLRASKALGSSLEAKPILSMPATSEASLSSSSPSASTPTLSSTGSHYVKSIEGEMADICIVSDIEIRDGPPSVSIEKAPGEKCVRCWKVLPEVGEKEPGLCNRCAAVVQGGA